MGTVFKITRLLRANSVGVSVLCIQMKDGRYDWYNKLSDFSFNRRGFVDLIISSACDRFKMH